MKIYRNLKKVPNTKKEPLEETRLNHTEISYRARNTT